MAKKKPRESPGLITQLREAIRSSGRSLNQIGKETGVDRARLSRFMTGKRGLSIEALDRIFAALRLRVVTEETPPGGEATSKGE
jgi:transcriptional regulator with XRE-family HTH domain